MGKLRDYFKRGFIGVLKKYDKELMKITIEEDYEDDNGKLTKLECRIDKEQLEELKSYKDCFITLSINGEKNKKRNEEFTYNKEIMIKNIFNHFISDNNNEEEKYKYITLEIKESLS